MNRSSLKSGIFLITYGIVLYLVLSHIGLVAGAGSYIMTVLRPVIIGVVMAYVINLLMRPMETKWLAGLWRRCPRLARGKRASASSFPSWVCWRSSRPCACSSCRR